MGIILFIIALILFVLLVVVHELGHAIAARRNGVKVEEFGIGFPPMAWSRKLKNGILFSLNWLPLGGFVRLKGENDNATSKGSYGAAPLKAKTKILLAGVVINWLTAVLIFTVLAVTGIPHLVEKQFTVASDTKITRQSVTAAYVEPESPAAMTGMADGDTLVSIGGQQITYAAQVTDIAKNLAGKEVQVVYERKGERKEATTRLNSENKDNKGYLGISPLDRTTSRSTWSAPVVGVGLTVQLTGLTLEGIGGALGNLFAGIFQSISPNGETRQAGRENISEAGDSVAGPLGIFVLLKQVSSDSAALMLYLIAVISLTLAVMNALPIPALDGGRLFVTLLFRSMKKPLTKELEEKINTYGFTSLMLLIVLITIVDVKRIF